MGTCGIAAGAKEVMEAASKLKVVAVHGVGVDRVDCEEAVRRKDRQAVAEHLTAYRELLTEHIRKEDEEQDQNDSINR
jgi:phosphoglycerate dehydrogenase-like enzyme